MVEFQHRRLDEIFSSFWKRFDKISDRQWPAWVYLLDNYTDENYGEPLTGLDEPLEYREGTASDYFEDLKEREGVLTQSMLDEHRGARVPNSEAISHIFPQKVNLPYNVLVDEKVAEITSLADLEETTYVEIGEQDDFRPQSIERQLGGYNRYV